VRLGGPARKLSRVSERQLKAGSSTAAWMKRRIDDWSVTMWSTPFGRANGEMTSSGWRGP
jgi:hypothetical protein